MKKVRSFSFFLAPKITYKLEQALYRSLTLYHLSPAILTNEINFTDTMKITKTIEKKMKVVPAWCNSELLQWIIPNELTISWIRRVIAKQVLNLRNNKSIKAEMSHLIWKNLYKTKFTGCMIWRSGFEINAQNLNLILQKEVVRTMIQINKNMFYELDRDPMNRYICPWQKVWNKAHRLTWKTWPVNHLRLFSIKNHEIYYEKGSFDAQKYVEDIKTALDKILNLSKFETWRVGLEMYDN